MTRLPIMHATHCVTEYGNASRWCATPVITRPASRCPRQAPPQQSVNPARMPTRRQPLRCAATASVSAAACQRMAAEALGYMVIAGSLVRSLPQILRCIQARSVDGLSMTSIVCETYVYFITTAYNLRHGYDFSTYGDVISCLVQDVLLIGMLFYFGSYTAPAMLALTATTAGFGWWCLSGAATLRLLTQLQAATVVLLAVGGRVPQIWLNWRRGNSGELSFITCLLNVMGCAARIITTLALTGDKLMLWGTGSQFVLNGVLLWQVIDTARQQGKGPFAPKHMPKPAA